MGWWSDMVGLGKAIDTDKYFVVCANYLGGCYGSTGPSSNIPGTNSKYGSLFPKISVSDIVDSQVRLLNYLNIDIVNTVVGPSMGGFLALDFATRFPSKVKKVISIGSGIGSSVLQQISNFEQILAIESDSNFRGGDYYRHQAPNKGLALARMIAHKNYVSLNVMSKRARGEILDPNEHESFYRLRYTVESYMLYQGKKFCDRFDANSYLRIIDSWQKFSSEEKSFSKCKDQNWLIISMDSDVCFYPEQQDELHQSLLENGINSKKVIIHTDKGHDSFLLEPELYSPSIKRFIESDRISNAQTLNETRLKIDIERGPSSNIGNCPETESNCRHEDFQSSALPTELSGQI